MPRRHAFLASGAAALLSVALAAPALAAAPTYSGTLYCDRASDGYHDTLDTLVQRDRKYIAERRSFWTVQTGYCANGSFDTSQLYQDP